MTSDDQGRAAGDAPGAEREPRDGAAPRAERELSAGGEPRDPLTPPHRDGASVEAGVSEAGFSDVLSQALGEAAKKAGLNPSAHSTTGHIVWAAMGGWRGVVESVVPSVVFISVFALTRDPWLAIGISVAIAAVFTIARLIGRTPPAAALGGLFAALVAAGFALFTGKAENNFIPGFFTNAAYGSGLLISALIGWGAVGLIGGYLMGEGAAWRRSKRKRRVYFWLTIAWAGLFFLRLAVQLPIYWQGEGALATLATVKLVMGIPLFAPMVAVTWLAVRSLYRNPVKGLNDDGGAQGS